MTKKKQLLLAIVGILVIGSGTCVAGTKIYEVVTAVKVVEKTEKVCRLQNINRIEFKSDDLTTLEKQNGVWKNIAFEHLNYDQEAVNAWVQSLIDAETSAVVKNVDNESAYGISDDSPMITVFDSENNHVTYHVGHVGASDNTVYVKEDEVDHLLVVPFDTKSLFNMAPNSWVDCKELLNIQDVSKVTYTNADEKQYTIAEHQGTRYLEGYYQMTCALKEEAVTAWLEAVKNMHFTGYVATTEDLAPYGLDKPAYTMSIGDKEIIFGKQTSDSVYAAFAGDKDVYCVDKDVYIQAVEMNFFDSIDKKILHYALEDIANIKMSDPQGTFEFIMNELKADQGKSATEETKAGAETVKVESEDQEAVSQDKQENKENPASPKAEDIAEATGTEKQEVASPAALCGKPLSSVEAEEWLNTIQESLQVEAELQNPEIEQKEERKAECSIIYQLKNGETVTVEFIPYDINYYILRYDNVIEFAVNKEKVTKLFTNLARFSK